MPKQQPKRKRVSHALYYGSLWYQLRSVLAELLLVPEGAVLPFAVQALYRDRVVIALDNGELRMYRYVRTKTREAWGLKQRRIVVDSRWRHLNGMPRT